MVTCDKMRTQKELVWGKRGQSHLVMVSLRFLLNIQLEMVNRQFRGSQGEGLELE